MTVKVEAGISAFADLRQGRPSNIKRSLSSSRGDFSE